MLATVSPIFPYRVYCVVRCFLHAPYTSIAGRSHDNGCFALGCLLLSVHPSELVVPCLGMYMVVLGNDGVSRRRGGGVRRR